MRSANRKSVVALLAAEGPLSRADLARATGLSRTTVSTLVADLVAAGQVVETNDRGTPHKGGSGRPPLLVSLAPGTGVVAGVDLGHRHLRVAVADLAGTVLGEASDAVDVDADSDRALDHASRLVCDLVAGQGLDLTDLELVGMCVPAPLDRRSSRINTGILSGWRDVSPAQELGRRLSVPVVADNDANLGALAEHARGAARGSAHAVFVKVASGVGAGIVLGGRLHRGATGRAGEIGHVQVGEDGAVCRCGNRGCLETLVTAPRLIEVLRPAYDEPLSTERVLELERENDAGVRRVLNDAGRVVGRALADLCNSLNPEVVVVGGSLGASDGLREGIRSAIDRYAQPDTASAVRVVAAELGPRAELVGALTLAVNRATA
nr:ROK family transcriptional regulator [Nocardioides thalensis]